MTGINWKKLDKEMNPPPKPLAYQFGQWLGEWIALKGIPLAIGTVIITACAFLTWMGCQWVWMLLFG